MRNDQVLLDVHEVVDRDGPQLGELLPALVEELSNAVALLALRGSVARQSHSLKTRKKTKERTVTTLRCPLPSQ